MAKLNDLEIRAALILHLSSKKNFLDSEIIQELHVYNGRAIADIVTLRDEPHCYEIKGDGDKLDRLLQQNEYYKKTFRRITLVTTSKFLEKAKEIAPSYWGIIVLQYDRSNTLTVRQYRASKVNPNYEKSSALLTLWKSELLSLIPNVDQKLNRCSRAVLAELVAETKESIQVSRDISKALIGRFDSI